MNDDFGNFATFDYDSTFIEDEYQYAGHITVSGGSGGSPSSPCFKEAAVASFFPPYTQYRTKPLNKIVTNNLSATFYRKNNRNAKSSL
ncbi:MAG: hypothetical protein QM727_00660 [Niabella sp.]